MRVFVLFVLLASRLAVAADPESQPAHGPWRFEVSLTPVSGQLNSLWVQHLGLGGQVAIAMSPRMRFLAGGLWNHQWASTDLGRKLDMGLDVWRGRGGTTLDAFVPGLAYVGTEFGLIQGQIAPFRFPHRFELGITGMAGAAATRVELKPVSMGLDGSVSPATSGDAGLRPTLGVGAGLRFEFLERFSFRVEVRHFALSSRVSAINGCGAQDLRAMDNALRGGNPVTSAAVSASCQVASFDGTDPATGFRRSNDVPLAMAHLRNPSSLFQSYLLGQVSLGVTF